MTHGVIIVLVMEALYQVTFFQLLTNNIVYSVQVTSVRLSIYDF